MFNYSIDITPKADEDIYEILEYIFMSSFNHGLVNEIRDSIYQKIYSLGFMPQKFQKVLWDYRGVIVKKSYRIFYRIDEKNKLVIIVRVLRSEQNYENIFWI